MSKLGWQHNPVGVYLMSCYAYEVLDDPFLTDHEFDACGRYIAENWNRINHPHKHLIDPVDCDSTSALTVPYAELPLIILTTTHQIRGSDFKQSPIYAEAMRNFWARVLV